jgi:RHS repeat-associated protein
MRVFRLPNCVPPRAVPYVLLKRRVVLLLLLCSLAASALHPLYAQNANSPGVEPFSTQTGSAYDRINLSSSSVMFTLPIRSKSGPISFAFSLVGAPTLSIVGSPTGNEWSLPTLGYFGPFQITTGASVRAVTASSTASTTACLVNGNVNEKFNEYNAISIIDSTGASHFIGGGIFYNPCAQTYSNPIGSAFTATDGSGYTAVLTGVGATTPPVFTVYDRSGNEQPGVLAPGLTGTTVTTPNGLVASQTQSSTTTTITTEYSDPLGPTVLTSNVGSSGTQFTYLDSSGNTQTVTLSYSALAFRTNFGCSAPIDSGPTTYNLPTKLTLPDGRAFTITYEATPGYSGSVTGRIASIGLPSGGSISYTYTGGNNNTGIYCDQYGDILNHQMVPTTPVLTRTINDANGNQSVWTYNFSDVPTPYQASTTTVTDPAGNATVYTFYSGYQTEQQTYQGAVSAGKLLKTVVTCYNGNFTNCALLSAPPVKLYGAITQTDVYTSYNGGPSSLTETINSNYGLPATVKEYDYGAATPPSGSPLTETDTTYGTWNGTGCVSISAYINDRPCDITVKQGVTLLSDVRNTYDNHGNLTQSSSLVSGSTYVTSSYAYDPNGAINTITDARGNSTTISNTGCNNLLPTSMTKGGLTMSETWDCNGGVMSSETGFNPGETTTYQYDDPLYRLTSVQRPDGGTSSMCYTDVGGSDCSKSSANVVYTATTAAPNPTIKSTVTSDGLGREISRSVTTDPQGASSVETTYDPVGRMQSVTNPHRSYSSVTDGTVSYSYDALGRMLLECNQDNVTTGTNVPCVAGASYRQWVYTGPLTDIYDEARHHWQQTVDGLGRLIDVKEPDSTNSPTLETKYSYDALSNLLNVNQLGASGNTPRVRSFTYDGLSRLIIAVNPETGTVCYGQLSGSSCTNGYDGNGNLQYRTDARGVVTHYAYDALNRITTKTYPTIPAGVASTSTVNYLYDIPVGGWGWPAQTSPSYPSTQQTNLVGRLSQVTLGIAGANAWTVYGYDVLGRTVLKSECLPIDCGNNHHDIHFRYDVAGNLTFYDRGLNAVENSVNPNQGFYFGGFTQTYDGAGNLASVTGDTAGTNRATNILSGTDYFPNGQRYTALELGIYNDKYSVTNRSWYTGEVVTDPASKTVWQTSAHRINTGTVNTTTDTVVGNWSYTYDQLNRLATAAGPSGHLSYTIDAFGNKSGQTVTSGTGPSPQGYLVAANNALTGNGLTYDASGNVTYDGFHHYTYDAEGRLYGMDGTTCYTYDGDGDRVARTNCNVSGAGFGTITGVLAEFLYDTDHRLLAEVNAATQGMANGNIWAGGQLVAQDAPDANVTTATATQLRITDQVGSLRGLLDLGEHVVQSCTSFPYGDGATCSTPADQFFTGKERDAETSLDYSGARYYNSTLGRFTSPDPSGLFYANPGNPQSLNLYSYAQNNPLTNTDPTGLDCVYFNDTGDGVESVDRYSSSAECNNTGGDYIRGRIGVGGYGYFPDGNGGSGTFAFSSSDANGTYTTYATAPGAQNDGTTCAGNCDLSNGFIPNYNGVPEDVALNPFAQDVFTQVGQQTAPVTNLLNSAVCGLSSASIVGTVAGTPVPKAALFRRTAGLGGSASKFTTVLGATSRALFGKAEIAGGSAGQALRGLTGTARVGGAFGRIASDAMPGLALTDLASTVACHF